MSYILGLDLGTSSLKGVVFNEDGNLLATTSEGYPLYTPYKGYSEQKPDDWLIACDRVIQKLKIKLPDFTDRLAGISFSGQMHSLVLLDENFQVIREAILWNDVRTSQQCQEIMSQHRDILLAVTRNIALEGFTLPKILWVQAQEPDHWQRVRHILLPKDYLRYYLTGKLHIDYSDAAGTLLFDLETKEWSQEICQIYNIPLSYLPELTHSADYVGDVKPELAKKYGFTRPVKVFAGAADNAASAIGAGILTEDVALASIGTSGVFLSVESKPLKNYDGKLHLFHHGTEDGYYSMGVTLAAGKSLDWFKNTFSSEKTYNDLFKNMTKIKPGADGLLFTPYIIGERTPYNDSKVRASFIGVDINHSFDHFVRAVVEGITYSLRESKVLMEKIARKQFNQVISVGGGAKNHEWLQIKADIFNTPVKTLQAEEGPGAGAAMLAAVGLGWFDTLESCSETFVKYGEIFEPNPTNVIIYNQLFELYQQIYPASRLIYL